MTKTMRGLGFYPQRFINIVGVINIIVIIRNLNSDL